MRTGEIVDLANERRLSAALDFARGGADLLVLNGGSKAEEFTVLTTVRGRGTKTERAVYCIDSGTSMHVRLPFPGGSATTADLTVEIVGDHGSMVLRQPATRPARHVIARRALATAAGIVALVVAGGMPSTPSLVASADPEPAPVAPPLVAARVSFTPPGHLPHVVVQPAHDVRPPALAEVVHPPKLSERRVVIAMAQPALAQPTSKHLESETPAPLMTDLHVPSTAKSGDFVPVRFGAVGRQVKIVASIGPEVVSKTIIAAQQGTIAIKSPKSDRLSRIMTVRAYAQSGKRSSTLQAIVVLVHP